MVKGFHTDNADGELIGNGVQATQGKGRNGGKDMGILVGIRDVGMSNKAGSGGDVGSGMRGGGSGDLNQIQYMED
ncbi:hypothetical protein LIER_42043 [Lithospermum erythrorhizon]|uniref:Uncharacterized protein n=1 Tax=Lithospermum erythrorhizon TaxID=34254 RepID=A0AAV3RLS9_LITER